MTAAHAAIDRPFLPGDLEPELQAAGIGRTVLVQSACSNEDTDFMLELAAAHEWIGAVVAWVDLERPAGVEARLDELLAHEEVSGIRHLIHDEPDPHWILRPTVLRGLALVEERGLILELPAVYPRHLGDVPLLAERFPGLRIVIDHLGKPPLDGDLMGWGTALAAAAAYENVTAKVSGLDLRILRPALEIALSAFGPERLMWGSDWPVCLLSTDYARVWAESQRAIAELAPERAHDLLGGTACGLYGLEVPAAAVADYDHGGARGAH
jgi:L-fuconolactonase